MVWDVEPGLMTCFNTHHALSDLPRTRQAFTMAQEKTPMLSPRREDPRRSRHVMLAVVGLLAAPLLLLATVSSWKEAVPEGGAASLDETLATTANAEVTSKKNLLAECDERFFTQTLDHFDVGAPTYQQRYFVCDRHFRPGGVMFFYVGNEADVELYLNHTGLMWENADEFGAMLVFAEHRYFGKSVPFGKDATKHMRYLSTEQTLADYAVLITYLKAEWRRDVPVIGFGGSYGGMLGSWFRMKYPQFIDGVVAASAPILSYFGDEVAHDLGGYSQVTTFDASPAAGSAENCVPNVRRAWPAMRALGKSEEGRQKLKATLALCEDTPLSSAADVEALMEWARDSFDSMAMGNYPYPSSYIMNGVSVLPAYPMRVACSHLQDSFDDTEEGELALLKAFSTTIGVYYNSTLDKECYELSAPSAEDAEDSNFWDYIYCAELYGPTTTDGVKICSGAHHGTSQRTTRVATKSGASTPVLRGRRPTIRLRHVSGQCTFPVKPTLY